MSSSYTLSSRDDLEMVDRKMLETAHDCRDLDAQKKLIQLRNEFYDRLMDKHKDKLQGFARVFANNSNLSKKEIQALYDSFLQESEV